MGPIRAQWAGVAPPMRFTGDVGELAVVLELDTEPAGVDLTRDGLGDAGLDAAVEGMLASHRARSSPDGQAWAPLSAATVRRKGHPVRLDGELVRRTKVVGAGRRSGSASSHRARRSAVARADPVCRCSESNNSGASMRFLPIPSATETLHDSE